MNTERPRILTLRLRSLRPGRRRADEDRRLLEAELGVQSAAEAVALVRTLQRRVQELERPPVPALGEGAAALLTDPRRVLEKVRDFTSRIDRLNNTVASMEDQLQSLYADRERLEREIGASEVDDVLATFEALRTTIRSMEAQLSTLYAGRETLEVELGRSDPTEIVAMFRNVAGLVQGAQRELGELGEVGHKG